MGKQKPNLDDVRFQISQFPDLAPIAERVADAVEGRGALVREVRRLLRVGLLAEAAGLGMRELQAMASGRGIEPAGVPLMVAAAPTPAPAVAPAPATRATATMTASPAHNTGQSAVPSSSGASVRDRAAQKPADPALNFLG